MFSSRNCIFSLTTKPSALLHSSWFFFPFTRIFFTKGFHYKLYLILKPSALPYSFWFFLRKVSLSKYEPSALSHSFWFSSRTIITNHRHYSTAFGFSYKITCSPIISTTVLLLSFLKKSFFLFTPTALQHSYWFFISKKSFFTKFAPKRLGGHTYFLTLRVSTSRISLQSSM